MRSTKKCILFNLSFFECHSCILIIFSSQMQDVIGKWLKNLWNFKSDCMTRGSIHLVHSMISSIAYVNLRWVPFILIWVWNVLLLDRLGYVSGCASYRWILNLFFKMRTTRNWGWNVKLIRIFLSYWWSFQIKILKVNFKALIPWQSHQHFQFR